MNPNTSKIIATLTIASLITAAALAKSEPHALEAHASSLPYMPVLTAGTTYYAGTSSSSTMVSSVESAAVLPLPRVGQFVIAEHRG